MPIKLPPYDIGDDLEVRGEARDSADALFDAVAGSLEIVCPDKATLTWDLTDLDHVSTGIYETVYRVANGWGTYRGTFKFTGIRQIVEQFEFRVRKTAQEEIA